MDGDTVDVSNKNRQLPALDATIGLPKTQVMAERIRGINPDVQLTVMQVCVMDEGWNLPALLA